MKRLIIILLYFLLFIIFLFLFKIISYFSYNAIEQSEITLELDPFENGIYPHIALAQCGRGGSSDPLPQPPEVLLVRAAVGTRAGTLVRAKAGPDVCAGQLQVAYGAAAPRLVPPPWTPPPALSTPIARAHMYHMFRQQLPRLTMAIGVLAVDDVTSDGEDLAAGEDRRWHYGSIRRTTGYQHRQLQRAAWHRYSAVWLRASLRKYIMAAMAGRTTDDLRLLAGPRRVLVRYNLARYHNTASSGVPTLAYSRLLLREAREKGDIIFWEMEDGKIDKATHIKKLKAYNRKIKVPWVAYKFPTEVGLSRKSLYWYLYATRVLRPDYVAKTDEDMFLRLPVILREVDNVMTPHVVPEAFARRNADGECELPPAVAPPPLRLIGNRSLGKRQFRAVAFGICFMKHSHFLPFHSGRFYAHSANLAALLVADTALFSRAGPLDPRRPSNVTADLRLHYFASEDVMVVNSLFAAGFGLRRVPGWFMANGTDACASEPSMADAELHWRGQPINSTDAPFRLDILFVSGVPRPTYLEESLKVVYNNAIESVHKLTDENSRIIISKYKEGVRLPPAKFKYEEVSFRNWTDLVLFKQ